MGANDFTHYSEHANVKDAFREAVYEASYEYGHGGYTGTIAEKHDFTVVAEARPMTKAQAEKLAYTLIENYDRRFSDKWGPAGAIPVIADGATSTRTVTTTVTVNGPESNEYEKVLAAVKEKVRLKEGEQILSIYAPTLGGRTEPADPTPAPVRKFKTVTTTPKAKTETRYIVRGDNQHDTWQTGFPTQAAARARAIALANTEPRYIPHGGVQEFSVVAETRRVSGEALLTVQRVLQKTTWTVRVTIVKQNSPNPSVVGWLFFGMASS